MNLSSLLGTALGLLMLAYFASAPFRTRVDAGIRDRTQWTAASIERNPSGYLEWASGEYDRLLHEIDAQRIQISFEHSIAEKTVAFEAKAIPKFQRRLEAAKTAYLTAVQTGSWPVQLEGEAFQQDQLAARILLLHSSLSAAQERSLSADKTIRIAASSLASLELLKTDLQAGLNDLTSIKLHENSRALAASHDQLAKQIQHIQAYAGAVKAQPDNPTEEAAVAQDVRRKFAEETLTKILNE